MLGDQAQPVDLELGITQRAVMRVLRRLESITVDEAGAIAHAGRGKHTVDERCGFCGPDGDPILQALERRGLIERGRDGVARLPQPAVPVVDVDPFPEGY